MIRIEMDKVWAWDWKSFKKNDRNGHSNQCVTIIETEGKTTEKVIQNLFIFDLNSIWMRNVDVEILCLANVCGQD